MKGVTSDLSVTQNLYSSEGVEAMDVALPDPRSHWEGPDGSRYGKPAITYGADSKGHGGGRRWRGTRASRRG